MPELLDLFVKVFLKFFFLLGPFMVVSTFLALTAGQSEAARKRVALRATVAIFVICFCLYAVGQYLFRLLGITLDAFRIGSGAILFLSGVKMVFNEALPAPAKHDGDASSKAEPVAGHAHDVAVVPLAIPITVGPGTTGALLVMGAELRSLQEIAVACGALFLTIFVVGMTFYQGSRLERLIGAPGLAILNKLTGLFLASLAAQIMFTGIYNLLARGGAA